MKKSLFWRGLLIVTVLASWAYTLFPLRDRDFVETFRQRAGKRVDARLEEMFKVALGHAQPLQQALVETATAKKVELRKLFPDVKGTTDAEVVAQLVAAEAKAPPLSFTEHFLPSIVSEQQSVAQVFWTRLHQRLGTKTPENTAFLQAAEEHYRQLRIPIQTALENLAAEQRRQVEGEFQKEFETQKAGAWKDLPEDELMAKAATLREGYEKRKLWLRQYVPLFKKPNARDKDITAAVQFYSKGSLRLGLDLRGGTEFVMAFDPADVPAGRTAADIRDEVIEILRNRIDQIGVVEPEIRPVGSQTISIKVPSVDAKDTMTYREMLERPARLEFREVHTQRPMSAEEAPPMGYELMTMKTEEGNEGRAEMVFVSKVPEKVGGRHLTDAFPSMDEFGNYEIRFSFNAEGARLFGDSTTRMYNDKRRLAIVLDGMLYSAPSVREPITGGSGQITGGFTRDEAMKLGIVLRSGNLPVKISLQGEFSTNPTLGAKSVQSSLVAGVSGLLIVAIFMMMYYFVPGVIANIALFCNMVIILGTMPVLDATVTLPGLAGIILTIGMAVDANVLIFERMREERAAGKTLGAIIHNGYDKAFWAIFDSNITTLFTGLILMRFGSGAVRGFAVTMNVGIVASMFTALFLTRWIFDLLMEFGWLKDAAFPNYFKVPRVPFLALTRPAIIVSLIVCAAGLGALVVRGHRALGVDFTGGKCVNCTYEHQVPAAGVEQALEEQGFKGVSATYKFTVGAAKLVEIVLPAEHGPSATEGAGPTGGRKEELAPKVASILNAKFPQAGFVAGSTDAVGSLVGQRFRVQALVSVGLGLLVILIYVSFRFEFGYGLGALVALFHDALITGTLFLLPIFGSRQISLTVVAAVLTIIGYSINDTVVIFDRIREDLQSEVNRRRPFAEVIEVALNETLSRTILTSLTVFFTTFTLFIFGGGAINDFALCMLIGVFSGTWSTLFVATPVMVWYHRLEMKRKAAAMAAAEAGGPAPAAARG